MVKLTARMLLFLSVLLTGLVPNGFAVENAHGPHCTQQDITGPIVRPRHNVNEEGKGDMNLSGFTVLSGVLAIGQGLKDGANKEAASVDKNFEAQDSYLRQVAASMGASEEKFRNMREFGPDSAAYNTADNFGASVSAGMIAQGEISERTRSEVFGYLRGFNKRGEILRRLQDSPVETAGSGDTMSAKDLALAKENIKTLVDPYPALNLNGNTDRGERATGYNSKRKAKEAQLLIPVAVLGDLMAARAPVMELGEWSGNIYEDAGENISGNEMLRTLSDMRFANQGWASGSGGIHSMTDTGALRELLMSKTDKLATEYQQLLWLDRITALMAQKQLSQKELEQIIDDTQIKSLQ